MAKICNVGLSETKCLQGYINSAWLKAYLQYYAQFETDYQASQYVKIFLAHSYSAGVHSNL